MRARSGPSEVRERESEQRVMGKGEREARDRWD